MAPPVRPGRRPAPRRPGRRDPGGGLPTPRPGRRPMGGRTAGRAGRARRRRRLRRGDGRARRTRGGWAYGPWPPSAPPWAVTRPCTSVSARARPPPLGSAPAAEPRAPALVGQRPAATPGCPARSGSCAAHAGAAGGRRSATSWGGHARTPRSGRRGRGGGPEAWRAGARGPSRKRPGLRGALCARGPIVLPGGAQRGGRAQARLRAFSGAPASLPFSLDPSRAPLRTCGRAGWLHGPNPSPDLCPRRARSRLCLDPARAGATLASTSYAFRHVFFLGAKFSWTLLRLG